MPKNKGPDLMNLPRENWRDSSWVPTSNLFEPYDWEELFGNTHPVEVELGAGDGGFILEKARREPERNFFALERLLGRARKMAKRAPERGLVNFKILRLESAYFIERLCPPGSVEVVHIMFPDPWPKKRHHKHRLIQPAFLGQLARVLKPGGEVRFTTDHEAYFQWAREHWSASPGWKSFGNWDAEGDPRTDFEQGFITEGREFFRERWGLEDKPLMNTNGH
jgi:tRNA (guanine-N7-)-methyltransferase